MASRVEATHARTEHFDFRDDDGAVLLLIILERGDERVTDRDFGAVDRVAELWLVIVICYYWFSLDIEPTRPVAQIHAPHLK